MADQISIDPTAIEHIVSVGGEDLLRHLTGLFGTTAPERIAAARAAADAGDSSRVYLEAHALRSAAANLGATRFVAVAAAIEARAKSGNLDGIGVLLKGLTDKFEEALAALEAAASPDDGTCASESDKGRAPPGMKRVVMVEDNPDSRILVETMLYGKYNVGAFSNGPDALAHMADRGPDIVLLDISLPDMDGTEILARMRADDRLKHIPAICITAHAMSGDREKYLAAGFDIYLTKPVDEELLLSAMESLLGG